jgi:hypothetical protein
VFLLSFAVGVLMHVWRMGSAKKVVDSLPLVQNSLVPAIAQQQKSSSRFNHDVITFKEDGLQEIRIKLL